MSLVPNLNGPICNNLEELVDLCVTSYRSNTEELGNSVRKRRSDLSEYIKSFHTDCGTLNPYIQSRINDLRNKACVVLMTAHQPNLFAYSGVLRKATLIYVLAKELEKRLEVKVVNFFGIADQDFTDDRWVGLCQPPAVQRREGILPINVKLPENLMLNSVVKPSPDLLKKWRAEIEKWLTETIRSVNRLCKGQGFAELSPTPSIEVLHKNFEFFWNVVEDCYGRSEKYSDFNAFIMLKIVNDVWGYDTVFSRFSECQQVFVDEFNFLLSRFEDYSRLLREAKQIPHDEDIGVGASDQEPCLTPYWYHCTCGSKVKLFLMENDGFLFGRGNCVGCGEHYELEFGAKNDPNISNIAFQISARAIPMCLVFFSGLMSSCYIGGLEALDT